MADGARLERSSGRSRRCEAAEDVEDLIGEEAKLGIRKTARAAEELAATQRTPCVPASVVMCRFQTRRSTARVLSKTSRLTTCSRSSMRQRCSKASGSSNKAGCRWKSIRRSCARRCGQFMRSSRNAAKREKLLVPKVVYGYFQCQSEGNDLIVYDEDKRTVRFTFPRQPAGKHLCLADFFASRDSGKMDVVAFHLVTVGRRASEYSHELFKADNYSDYLYFHGLSVESAEALAELWHKRIREELGIAGADSPDVDATVPPAISGLALQFRLSGLSATRGSGEAV